MIDGQTTSHTTEEDQTEVNDLEINKAKTEEPEPEEEHEQEPKPEQPGSFLMLRQSVEDAYYLHNYSITTGQNIPEEISTAILEFKHIFDRHEEPSITTEAEVKFSTAYRKLAALMLPVTVESLRDTEDSQVDSNRPFFKRLQFSKVKQITLLLPLLAIFLILLILGSEIIQSIFISGLQDISAKEKQFEEVALELKEIEKQLTPLSEIEEFTMPEKLSETKNKGLKFEELEVQQSAILSQKSQLTKQLQDKQTQLNDKLEELGNDIVARLKSLKAIWDNLLIYPLFFKRDQHQDEWVGDLELTILIKTKFAIITEVLNRLLPILYGALGATAYFLRMLIPHIRNRTFNKKHSGSISVRICLGMLSGIAIQWFFSNDQQQAQIFERALSTSALAFLAGYSVDLLFNIMDRFLVGFKTPENPSSNSQRCREET